MDNRTVDLINKFDDCLQAFDEADPFPGPSLYFHEQAMRVRNQHASLATLVTDENFFDRVYATLACWGMHRMGDTATKLVAFSDFCATFRDALPAIEAIENLRLREISDDQVADAAARVWNAIVTVKVGIGETRIVGNSKAIHHMLPHLLPPIDREYTLRFFGLHLAHGEESDFGEMFRRLALIARECDESVSTRLGSGWYTSPTKIIDNAIIGYTKLYLPRSKGVEDPHAVAQAR